MEQQSHRELGQLAVQEADCPMTSLADGSFTLCGGCVILQMLPCITAVTC